MKQTKPGRIAPRERWYHAYYSGSESVPVMTATAKLIMDGDDQIVVLPDEFAFECAEVQITIVGDKVILEPITDSKPEANE